MWTTIAPRLDWRALFTTPLLLVMMVLPWLITLAINVYKRNGHRERQRYRRTQGERHELEARTPFYLQGHIVMRGRSVSLTDGLDADTVIVERWDEAHLHTLLTHRWFTPQPNQCPICGVTSSPATQRCCACGTSMEKYEPDAFRKPYSRGEWRASIRGQSDRECRKIFDLFFDVMYWTYTVVTTRAYCY